jgi:precorrin-3B methylase
LARGGSLTVAGTGFLAAAHTTPEARDCLREAESLLYLVGDPVTEEWLREVNPVAESLSDAYAVGKPRMDTYREIADRILAAVRQNRRVCAAFYGHPGVFVTPSHDAIRRAREEEYPARMLPGISAEDCLFADLEMDPAARGCQSFEATHFVEWELRFDPHVPLILWQVGAIQVRTTLDGDRWRPEGLRLLTSLLHRRYPADHPVVAYEAPLLSVSATRRESMALSRLPEAEVSIATTLYIPPLGAEDSRREDPPPAAAPAGQRGRLVVVGTGYGRGHLTPEARVCIERARDVLALRDAHGGSAWLAERNPAVRFVDGGDELEREVLGALERGGIVCAALPGHPCVGTLSIGGLLGKVRAAGLAAKVYPGISCEDCLFAELGLDPATSGRILFRAEDFVGGQRTLEPLALLVLLHSGSRNTASAATGPPGLAHAIRASFPGRELVTVYEPCNSSSPGGPAACVPLDDLEGTPVTAPAAYCLPPS